MSCVGGLAGLHRESATFAFLRDFPTLLQATMQPPTEVGTSQKRRKDGYQEQEERKNELTPIHAAPPFV